MYCRWITDLINEKSGISISEADWDTNLFFLKLRPEELFMLVLEIEKRFGISVHEKYFRNYRFITVYNISGIVKEIAGGYN